MYLIKRGKRAVKREAVAHIARYNPHGQIQGAWCWRTEFNLTSNVPWGLRVCRDCARRAGWST